MKKSSLFMIIFAAVVLGAVAFLLMRPQENSIEQPSVSQNERQSEQPAETVPEEPQTPETTQPEVAQAQGVYTNYSEAVLANATGKRVLFFHAPWCPQCRSIESGIKTQGIPDGYTVIKVDYDSNQDLRKKYGVTLQTTFVSLDENAESTGKYVAYDEPTFDAVKRDFIK